MLLGILCLTDWYLEHECMEEKNENVIGAVTQMLFQKAAVFTLEKIT